MEFANRKCNRKSFKNHKSTIGWRLENNEELSRTESETDDFDDSGKDRAQIKAEDYWHGWNLMQKNLRIQMKMYYEQVKEKIYFLPGFRNHKSTIGRRLQSNEELSRTESETDDYDDSGKDRAQIKAEDYRHGWNLMQKNLRIQIKIYYEQVEEKIYFLPGINIKKYLKGKFAFKFGQEGKSALTFAILTLLFSLIIYLCFFIDINSKSLSNEKRLRDEIKNIHSEFHSQEDDIWYTFSSGIKDVEGDPSHPSVFLILYDGGEDTPTCLAIKIAKVAMNFLNVTKSAPIVLDGLELGKNKTLKNDYGELIAEEKQRVEEYRTMIVKNIHKVPGKVAQSFHSFCDTYTPLVDKAVYLFTLHAVGASDTHHPTALAEEELEQSWKKELHEDILKPLITRITDNVVVVKSEEHLPTSCLEFI